MTRYAGAGGTAAGADGVGWPFALFLSQVFVVGVGVKTRCEGVKSCFFRPMAASAGLLAGSSPLSRRYALCAAAEPPYQISRDQGAGKLSYLVHARPHLATDARDPLTSLRGGGRGVLGLGSGLDPPLPPQGSGLERIEHGNFPVSPKNLTT